MDAMDFYHGILYLHLRFNANLLIKRFLNAGVSELERVSII